MSAVLDAICKCHWDDDYFMSHLHHDLVSALEARMATMERDPETYAQTPGEWQVQAMLVIELLCKEADITRSARHAVMAEARGTGSPRTMGEAFAVWHRGRSALLARLADPEGMEGA